jgi:hypothetical protein
MSVLPLSCPTKRLAVAITNSATTFAVNNIKGWDGNNLTSANFGTVAYVVFRNSTNTLMEIMQIDPTTIANASITINLRGLDFNGGTSEVSANKLAWPANDTLVDFGSDPAQLFKSYVDKTSDETISSGIKTLAAGAKLRITDAPSNSLDAVNKTYADGLAIAGAPDASTSTKGIAKMSVAPVSSTSPIAVGDNDTRVPPVNTSTMTAGQVAALASTTTPGSGNKYISQTDFQKGAEIYAADAVGTDSYAITLSPALAAYTAGQVFRFKAATANTGAATLNVNSLGAKSILRPDGSALADGDIAANQLVQVIYDGTNMLLLSPVANAPKYKNGQTTYDISTASGTLNIAHGLGRAPRKVRVRAWYVPASNTTVAQSDCVYDGSTTAGITTASCVISNTPTCGVTSNIVAISKAADGSGVTATLTVDATNLILTTTKNGSPTGSVYIVWEAEA